MAVIDLSGVQLPIQRITKAQYAALVTKDPGLMYIISDSAAADVTIYLGEKALAKGDSVSGVLVENVTREVREDGVVELTVHYSNDTESKIEVFDQNDVTSSVTLDDQTNEIVVEDLNGGASRIALNPIITAAVGNPIMSVDASETGILTFTHKDATTTPIDLPMESVIQSVSYDDETHILTFTLVSGSTTTIDLNALVPVTVGVINETTDADAVPTAQAVVDFVASVLKIGTIE